MAFKDKYQKIIRLHLHFLNPKTELLMVWSHI